VVTFKKYNYEIEILDSVFDKMLEYCDYDKDTLINKILQSNVYIGAIEQKHKIKNSDLIYKKMEVIRCLYG